LGRYGEEAVHFGRSMGQAEFNPRRVVSATRHVDGLANRSPIV